MVEKKKYIIKILKNYNNQVKTLNKLGLFDEAKHFELFAIELARIWFETDFINANVKRSNEPYIDLISIDETIAVQVSTVIDCQTKINETLEKFYSQKKINKKLKFILLSETEITNINIKNSYDNFHKENDIINLSVIFNKLDNQLDFVNKLYNIIINFFDKATVNLDGYKEALNKSKYDLSQISTSINNDYKVDRTAVINKIKKINKSNIVIAGKPGSGKSALCKELLYEESTLYTRAEKFLEYDKLNDLWGFDFSQIALFSGDKKINIFIDSLESIMNIGDKNNLLGYLIDNCKNYNNIKIYFTCRRNDVNSILNIDTLKNIELILLDNLKNDEIQLLKQKYPILNNYDKKNYGDLLSNLWYVNMIVKMLNEDETFLSESELRIKIWDEVCRDKSNPKNNSERKAILKAIILERVKNNNVFVNKDTFNEEIIYKLLSDDILIENQSRTGIKLKYDIFEDLFFERELDFLYENNKDHIDIFFEKLDKYGKFIYRKFKNWLDYKLLNIDIIDNLIEKTFFDINSTGKWYDYTIIGLVKADNSKYFFEKYKDTLLSENYLYLIRLIDYINLYCFDLNHNYKNIIQLLSSGNAREQCIKMIVESKLYKDCKLDNRVRKLVYDWVNGITLNSKLSNNANMFKEIIIYYLSLLENTNNHDHEVYFKNLNMLYSLSEISTDEIIDKWHVLKTYLEQYKDEEKFGFAKKIIKETLQNCNYLLIKNLPKELCELASYFWKYEYNHQQIISQINNKHFHMQNKKFNDFGLSDHFGLFNYDTLDHLFITRSFIYPLLKIDFAHGLKFIIDFLNDCVSIYNNLEPNVLKEYTLLVDDKEKTYFGDESFWVAYRGVGNVPELIKDMLMSLEYFLLNDIDSNINMYVAILKVAVLEKSNNVFLFPLLISIALRHFSIFKEYFIDIASNIDIIIMDVHRANSETSYRNIHMMGFNNKFEREFIEKFNNLEFRSKSIQDYIIDLQFIQCDKTKVYKVIDYLYSNNENSEENATRYLNIQKMDFRKCDIKEVDGGLVLEPKIDGAAKVLNENKEKELAPYTQLIEKANILLKDITNGQDKIEESVEIIELILTLDHVQVIISELNKVLELLIIYVISKKELNDELREKYVDLMIYELKDLISINSIGIPESYNVFSRVLMFEAKHYYIIWSLLNNDVSKKIYDKIIKSMINIILSGEYAGQLSYLLKDFLDKNEIIKNNIFQTILQLSRLDMKKRMERYNICKKKKIQFDYEFDLDSLYKKCKIRKNKKILIPKKINYNIMMTILNYNFSIVDNRYSSFFSTVFSLVVRDFKNNHNRIFDFTIVNNLKNILKHNLLLDEEHAKQVINVIFNLDMNNINYELTKFINDTFASLFDVYFDSFDNPMKRKLIYKILELIEDKVKDDEKLTKMFYLPLIFTSNNMYSWDDYQTKYSLKDKEFINKNIIKYGKYNIVQAITNIDNLKSDELLPEILISINELLKEIKHEEFIKVRFLLVKIITKTYKKCFNIIKDDKNLYDTFIEILLFLIKNNITEAAFLLEEIR